MSIAQETVSSRTIASILHTTTMEQMPQEMGKGFGRIMGVLIAQGLAPTGPPMTIYPEPMADGGPLAFQTAVPVPADAVGDGDVVVEVLPAGPVVVAMHEGPYEEVGRTYSATMAEMRAAGMLPGGPPREIYLNDPSDTPPEKLLTRIEFPVFEPD